MNIDKAQSKVLSLQRVLAFAMKCTDEARNIELEAAKAVRKAQDELTIEISKASSKVAETV